MEVDGGFDYLRIPSLVDNIPFLLRITKQEWFRNAYAENYIYRVVLMHNRQVMQTKFVVNKLQNSPLKIHFLLV